MTEGWLDGRFVLQSHPSPACAGAPLQGSQMGCRGRRCGVAQRSMPQWGIELHEWASSARVDANLRVGRRGGFYIRPLCTRTCRGVGDAAPYTQPHGFCRGAQCAPGEFCGSARLRGRTLFAPTVPHTFPYKESHKKRALPQGGSARKAEPYFII